MVAVGVVALGSSRLRGRPAAAPARSAATLERTTREAEEADSRLQVLVEHVPAAVYIDMADPDVSDGGRLAYMSPQIAGILGYRPTSSSTIPSSGPAASTPRTAAAAIAAYDEHWRTGEPLRAEYRMLARDGSEVWVRDEAYAMADDTQSGRRVSQGLLVDTTDRKRLESQLIHDALHDPLTGLANRVLLRDHLERALARQRPRAAERSRLLFVDLDDFKRVNDSLRPRGRRPDPRPGRRAAGRRGPGRATSSGARAATSSRSCSPGPQRGRGDRVGRADPRRAAPADPARRAVDRRRWLDRDRR